MCCGCGHLEFTVFAKKEMDKEWGGIGKTRRWLSPLAVLGMGEEHG